MKYRVLEQAKLHLEICKIRNPKFEDRINLITDSINELSDDLGALI